MGPVYAGPTRGPASGAPRTDAAVGATPSGTYSSVPPSSLKLKFDTISGGYNLSWQTSKNISGCPEMLLRFTGGVERTARFRFK